MKFKRYTDVHEFYNDTYDVLMLSESQNMIILGNVIIGHEGKDKTSRCDPAYWLMATVSDAKGILHCRCLLLILICGYLLCNSHFKFYSTASSFSKFILFHYRNAHSIFIREFTA
jgi:hypothetical protein